ncbi:unnamed protein product [Rotaria sordida]|uniref:Thiamine pyrophosphate enzyme N-terminal TPP-binding domain-containing protein n=1 Tax=Rotaria sordida TaxID=392033 RepID=A0A818UAK7_9BILA|nr:unnamed protein product [Rotaria sordida]
MLTKMREKEKVNDQLTAYGGELVVDAHRIPYLFDLFGGHISALLVACDKHNTGDAVSRLSDKIGVCVVTTRPGLINTITTIKNTQMAESPLLLLGGCAANLSKGRGALQDIDHMSLFKSISIFIAQSRTPEPVFVEFPIDVLYPFHLVECEVVFDEQICLPIAPEIPYASNLSIEKAAELVRSAKTPVCLLGNQSILPSKNRQSMGIPRFLGSMSRGLLGLESTVDHLNPVHVLQELENQLPDNAILISDDGDFVATAAYIFRSRGLLTWLDPGVFGTLGVGTEFALDAKLVRSEASVWIIYGSGVAKGGANGQLPISFGDLPIVIFMRH